MISFQKKISLLIKSTVNLMVAFLVILLLKWLFILMGAWLSGFQGNIRINGLEFVISSSQWNRKQVLGIYLLPYFGFVLLYFVVSFKRRIPLKLPKSVHLFYSWFYTLIVVVVFLNPIGELFFKTGIYYALSWLYFETYEKLLFILVITFLYAINVFRVSSLFSASLIVNPNEFLRKGVVLSQLPYLWFFPYLLLLMFVVLMDRGFNLLENLLLSGLGITLFLNTFLISRYKVILK